MKRTVILCLSVLICLVLSVKCDDEVTLSTNDEGNTDDVDDNVGSSDGKNIEAKFDAIANDNSADGGIINQNDSGDKPNLKCLVCKAIIEVMLYEIKKINPRKKIEVKSNKSIQYSKSESYLAELMEDLCEYQDTFAILRQVLVQKTFIQSMLDNNGSVDASPGFSPERLSTENLNFMCLEILGDIDDVILAEFKKEVLPENIDEIICKELTKYCDEDETEVNNERDEL